MSYIPICVPSKLRRLANFRHWHLTSDTIPQYTDYRIHGVCLISYGVKVFCGYAYENLQPPYVENGLGRIRTPDELVKAVPACEPQVHITAYNGQHSAKLLD